MGRHRRSQGPDRSTQGQAIRGLERANQLSSEVAARAAARFAVMRIERHPHRLILRRVWDLPDNLTAYDAACVGLAELLDVSLLTLDRRLAGAAGTAASIEVLT